MDEATVQEPQVPQVPAVVVEHTPVPVSGEVRIGGRPRAIPESADMGTYRTIVLVGTEDKQQILPFDRQRIRATIMCISTSVASNTTTAQGSTTGTQPAAGAEELVTVPAGHTWAPYAIQFTLTTSATVATRQVTLIVDNGTTDVWRIELPVTQAASLTYEYVFSGYTNDTAVRTIGTSNEVLSELPLGLPMAAGWRIRTVTAALQAGDQYSAAVVDYQDTTANTQAAVYLGSEAQCAAVKAGNSTGGGFYLPAGQSLPVAHKEPLWLIPDGTHPVTISIAQERMAGARL